MKSVIRFLLRKVVVQYNERYYAKSRSIKLMGFDITINPIVYHENYIESTNFLADTIITEKLSDKYILEIGNTCGLISLFAAKKGANASVLIDNIDVKEQVRLNFIQNNLNIKFINSFTEITSTNQKHDFIIINQPYLFAEEEWEKFSFEFSENYEYYKNLFEQLHSLMHLRSVAWLCIDKSEPYELYSSLALKYDLRMDLITERSFLMFDLLLYKIYPVKN